MTKKIYDVAIIGAGPAGLTAAIYASRALRKTILFEKQAPGGKLLNSHVFDNYPGMQAKAGHEIAMSFYNQAESFGTEFEFSEVVNIKNPNSDIKILETSNGEFKAKTIIITAGMQSRKLNVDGFSKYFGKGISTCVVCDGAFHKNKEVAIVGGGYSAVEETMFISKIASKVWIINNTKELNGEKITLEKVKKLNNVIILNNTEITEIKGEAKLSSIVVKNLNTNKSKEIKVSGVFTYIGFIPETSFVSRLNILNTNSYIKTSSDMSTSVPGIYAAGDVIEKSIRQVTTAVSDGTIAALSADKYLSNK